MKSVIVLSHLMDERGELSSESKRRARCGVEILRDREYDSIITLGWAYRQDTSITLAESMKQYMTNVLDVQHSKIQINTHSRDTVGDAIFSKLFFLNNNIILTAPLFVVTSFFHLKRTKEIFKFVYAKTVPLVFVPTGKTATPMRKRSEINSLRSFKNTFFDIQDGDICEIVKRLYNDHPYYNGLKFAKNPYIPPCL